MSDSERLLTFQLKALKAPKPVQEHRFAAEHIGHGKQIRARLKEAGLKDWRFDLAWPDKMLAVEVEGGGGMGRHTTAKGFRQDLEKYHAAMDLGWNIYRCDTAMIKQGKAAGLIIKLLEVT